jgi:hypothetical protein
MRGEHIRTLAANLDLIGVCLESRNSTARADAALRRRIQDRGREATAQELALVYSELAVEISLQHGVVSHGGQDGHAAAALETVAAHGIVATLRRHKTALNRLATLVDRTEAGRGAKATLLMVHQKPGDDFLGYPQGSAFDGMTWCQFLEDVARGLETAAAILALIGDGPAAAVVAVAFEAVQLIKFATCKQDALP